MSKPLIYTTSTGVELTILPVSPFLVDKVSRSTTYPSPPTYKIETITEETIEVPHDEESIKSELATPEERAAWALYKADYAKAEADNNERILNLLLFKGVGDVPERSGWEEEQNELGISVPSSPVARKVHYLSTEVVPDPNDLARLARAVMEGAVGTSPEEQEAAEAADASFRHPVAERLRANLETEVALSS